jgi:hypothetical protein
VARTDEYREALRLAEEALNQADLSALAQRAGAEVMRHDVNTLQLRLFFFNDPVHLRPGNPFIIRNEKQGTEVSLEEKIVICHYLLQAKGTSPAGQWITFRQIPDGQFYDAAFQQRTRGPFLSFFGDKPDLFRASAEQLAGVPIAAGDAGMIFPVLPRVPVQLILWQGDEELPPESTILFDATISDYLPAEDIAVLSGMLVYRIISMAKTLQG